MAELTQARPGTELGTEARPETIIRAEGRGIIRRRAIYRVDRTRSRLVPEILKVTRVDAQLLEFLDYWQKYASESDRPQRRRIRHCGRGDSGCVFR